MPNVKSPNVFSRLLLYWLAVFAACWILAFTCIWSFSSAYERYDKKAQKIADFFIADEDTPANDWSGDLLGFIMPLLLIACASSLLLTDAILPHWRLSFGNKLFVAIRRVVVGLLKVFKLNSVEDAVRINRRDLTEKEARNQFGVGDANFNFLGMIFSVVPIIFLFFLDIPDMIKYGDEEAGEKSTKGRLLNVSLWAGWVGTYMLSFFLIPVSRHSILLVAMNWSPVHALRLHVWAGYASFVMVTLHAITMVIYWFLYPVGKVYEEVIPPKTCWTESWVDDSRCDWQFLNLSGLIAFLFFLILWATSLHWFRRKYYRLFYIFHVVFGTLMMIGSVWHFQFIALYFAPGVLYYLVSTMPTLIQALASRFRGGVKITQVVKIKDAGDCLEVHIATSDHSYAILADYRACKYVRLCVPSISLVWHPFTVYRTNSSNVQTLRFLFRPVGPFTRDLASRLLSPQRPVTLIDGFYLVGDRCQDALRHDHVTIIAGGVAITPFLSLIPSLLREISNKNHNLHSMEFIWICREAGLKRYIFESYIKGMIQAANSIGDFEFKVKIFYTGPISEENSDSSENLSNVCDQKQLTNPMDSDDSICDDMVVHESCGHVIEVARMMSARYSQIRWNIPLFIAFTVSVITGFHFLMFRYDWEATDLKSFSHETWIFILVILFFIGVGVVTEASVLVWKKYWPAPRLDSFDVVETESAPSDTEKGIYDLANLETKNGRPGAVDIFNDTIKASCSPGIIMCGPVSLTTMIRNEAAKENSYLAYTRYVLYEEAWEM